MSKRPEKHPYRSKKRAPVSLYRWDVCVRYVQGKHPPVVCIGFPLSPAHGCLRGLLARTETGVVRNMRPRGRLMKGACLTSTTVSLLPSYSCQNNSIYYYVRQGWVSGEEGARPVRFCRALHTRNSAYLIKGRRGPTRKYAPRDRGQSGRLWLNATMPLAARQKYHADEGTHKPRERERRPLVEHSPDRKTIG